MSARPSFFGALIVRKVAASVAAVVVFSLVGCIPSLQPVYTQQDVVFDRALLGVWSTPQSNDAWSFTKSEGKAYRFVYTDKNGKKGAFLAHLANIDGTMLLDLYPEKPELDANDFYKLHLVPAHTFMLVDAIEPTLRLRVMNPDWLRKLLQERPGAIEHQSVDGEWIVLTATTERLQQFIVRHARTKEAFGKPFSLRRVKTSDESP